MRKELEPGASGFLIYSIHYLQPCLHITFQHLSPFPPPPSTTWRYLPIISLLAWFHLSPVYPCLAAPSHLFMLWPRL